MSRIAFRSEAKDSLRGKLCWKLPSTLLSFHVSTSKLSGPSPTEHLPCEFRSITLYQNLFSGSLNFCDLPPRLKNLSLHQNKFVGSIDLSSLPATLSLLSLGVNSLTGELNFTQLPSSLEVMDFMMNQFHGVVDLDHLPRNLYSLELSFNPNLSGVYRASRMPKKMRTKEKFFPRFKYKFHLADGDRFNIEGTDIVAC